MKALFLGKKNDPYSSKAAEKLQAAIKDCEIHSGNRLSSWPSLKTGVYDYVISYLSPWIVPAELLHTTRVAAINFHPGPPEYPGIGCTNFALYEGVSQFGVTCHHMVPRVDTGKIILVKRFPIESNDTVDSLTQRCYLNIAKLFEVIVDYILKEAALPVSEEKWQRRPFLRKELNALCRMTPDMTDEEIKKRIRATLFPGHPGPYVELAGHRFLMETNQPKSKS